MYIIKYSTCKSTHISLLNHCLVHNTYMCTGNILNIFLVDPAYGVTYIIEIRIKIYYILNFYGSIKFI